MAPHEDRRASVRTPLRFGHAAPVATKAHRFEASRDCAVSNGDETQAVSPRRSSAMSIRSGQRSTFALGSCFRVSGGGMHRLSGAVPHSGHGYREARRAKALWASLTRWFSVLSLHELMCAPLLALFAGGVAAHGERSRAPFHSERCESRTPADRPSARPPLLSRRTQRRRPQ